MKLYLENENDWWPVETTHPWTGSFSMQGCFKRGSFVVLHTVYRDLKTGSIKWALEGKEFYSYPVGNFYSCLTIELLWN